MKRRLNYTGRIKLPVKCVSITLNVEDDEVKSFNADIDLVGYKLPSKAKVYVEVYHKTEFRRFDFGTVKKIRSNVDTDLSSIAYGYNLKFRLTVVDETGEHGLILAHADRVRPKSDVDKKEILPVEFRDIGQQVWKISYEDLEDAPVLILNNNIPDIKNLARKDPQFFVTVYPSVIKEVLMHMIFVRGVDSPSDPSTEWHKDWIIFAKSQLVGVEVPQVLDPDNDGFNGMEVAEWIQGVVEEFSESRSEWKSFIKKLDFGDES